jgi:transcriptional regulator with XRE-family HTH domain
MNDENPPLIGKNIQRIRKKQQLTLDILAERSGVSKAMLSQIESQKVNPTVATVWKIARGLGIELDAILKGKSESTKRFIVIRKGNMAVLDTVKDSLHVQVLSPIMMAEDLEIYILTFDKGSSLHSKPHEPKSEEYLTILEGTFRVKAGTKESELHKGDFIIYNCDIEHSIENIHNGSSKIHMIVRFPEKQWH